MQIELTDYQAAKILEAGRFIGELGNGPDLSDVCEIITDAKPDLMKGLNE
jgi:hypothetical protein